MRKPKPLNPKSMCVVVSEGKPLTPRFYHDELGKAAQRQISKAHKAADLKPVEVSRTDGSFEDAVEIVSRENRWLAISRQDKSTFEALCEGWVTMAESGPGPSSGDRG